MPSTRVLLNTWAALLVLFSHVHQCRGDGAFLKPPPEGLNKDYSGNEVYYVGDILPIRWNKNLTQVTITMFQDNFPGDMSLYPYEDILTDGTGDRYDWKVSTMGMNLDRHNVFYYILSSPDNGEFNSHYFNISDERPTTSSATPSSTATSSTSTSTSTNTLSETASPALPSATNADDAIVSSPEPLTESNTGNSITPGQAVGITIGGIVGLALIIGGVWYAMKRAGVSVEIRRHKKADGSTLETAELPDSGGVAEVDSGDTPVLWKYGSELPHKPVPLEAGSTQVYEFYGGGNDRHELA
ncbi:hypothetical protein V8F20_008797 [Naviculisporaceae sp. PSN 640]